MTASNFFLGDQGGWSQLANFNPQQQQAFSQILQQALSGLQNPTQGFEPIAQNARQQFNTQTIPSLAERFTSMGGDSRQQSSAFAGALGSASSGLDSQLAALKAQYGLQNQNSLQNLLGMGLTPQFENVFKPRQPGFLESLLGEAGKALVGGVAGGYGQSLGLQNLMNGLGQQGQQKAVNNLSANRLGGMGGPNVSGGMPSVGGTGSLQPFMLNSLMGRGY